MTHSDTHLDAMLRHLGAAYYEATQGRATRAGHPRQPGGQHPYTHRWARRVEDVMSTSVITVRAASADDGPSRGRRGVGGRPGRGAGPGRPA